MHAAERDVSPRYYSIVFEVVEQRLPEMAELLLVPLDKGVDVLGLR